MSIARVVEISSTSDKSFENAVEQDVARASKDTSWIRSAWVKEQEVQVEGGQDRGVQSDSQNHICTGGHSISVPLHWENSS